ncbi:hypothetical protein KKD70_02680 [Patescibacteria group bacterium]|nr:hypothetical protein [Patescibacteria group bacterium]
MSSPNKKYGWSNRYEINKMALPVSFDRTTNMTLNHKTPDYQYQEERRININDLRIVKSERDKKISLRPHTVNGDEIAAYNIRESIQHMKIGIKKIYEVVRGVLGLERMPVRRAEEIVYHNKFRADETPEQRLRTIEAAKRIIAKKDAQKTAENQPLRTHGGYVPPQSARNSASNVSLQEIIASKKAKRESKKF